MAEDDDRLPAALSGRGKAGLGQSGADTPALISGVYPDRGQGEGSDRLLVHFDEEGREKNMADDPCILDRDQRNGVEPVGGQFGDELAFARPAKGGVMNFSDGGQIRRFGATNKHA